MDSALALGIGLLIGLVIGAAVAVLLLQRRARAGSVDPALLEARHTAQLADLRGQQAQLLADASAREAELRAALRAELAALDATADGLGRELNAQREQYRELAERHRADAERRSRQEHEESQVLQALAPVQHSLEHMQAKVAELEQQRSRQHGELAQQLKTASESEERLRSTTESLASALRNNATRGVWGETQLRNVVEAAGLTQRVDFDLQSSITSDNGIGRPDMVVRLPGGKSIAVDAKVPFAQYLEASTIPVTATGEEAARRTALLAQHVKAVRSHVDALAAKGYWRGLESSPEFVICFIPSESLLAAALEADASLLDYAFGKRVALASPVNLWAVLKTVAFTWQQDVLTEDAKRLFDLGKELYQRLSTLSDHADRLRRSIESTVTNYNQFASSFETRVLVTARKLDALDEATVIGQVSQSDASPKRLTAPEAQPSPEPSDGEPSELEARLAHRLQD
ncbi:DNA recombination protein RmuC [Plantibacter sp. PA-3-X8]|uniref:DNA recombination protein RmuC n=1 Tax=Plantibacter sp. PA-3-X8 TaxID=2480625 RepID=UPI000F5FB128|nr:DNA recombination protein RmuC [Plantibacter sp. PA-3-X8]AZH83358.1 DNA recombination protein RmuC [Plantibacter sp. PA-3-X8]